MKGHRTVGGAVWGHLPHSERSERSGRGRAGRRGRARATALTAAVVSSLLGGTPAAQAAPSPSLGPGGGTGATAPDDAHTTHSHAHMQTHTQRAQDSLPAVWPRPQSMRARGAFVPVGREVTLVADEDADGPALDVLSEALRDAGARTVHRVRPGQGHPGSGGGLVVRAGARSAGHALRALGAPPRGDLPRGGYRLAVGHASRTDHAGNTAEAATGTVALEGRDGAGLFAAAQTLRRLVTTCDGARGFPGVTVRDWPTTPVRGITEGFYGSSWSQRERLAQLDFLGRTKQNRYLYAPGDDPYRQASRWRDPYPAATRADFRALAERARRNHVTLGWSVSPGQGLCFSSPDDRRALLRKVDAMWALGFRAFQLSFEDVSYSEWHCDEDTDAYGSGPKAAAHAHAELANAVAAHLTARHPDVPDAAPLSVMPTEYYQKGATAYRTALAERLSKHVEVAWTGVGVVPRTITGRELAAAREAFGHHPLVTTDNYPVNDYARDRLFLGPYRGREPAVAAGSAALLANAMQQPTASRIPLFTAADFAWNPRGYRPRASWEAAVEEVAGGPHADARTRAAVHALAGNDASSVLGGTESAYLRPLLEDFWNAYEEEGGAGDSGSGDPRRLRHAADRLRAAFRTMRTAPDRVPEALAHETRPWLAELARYGEAGEQAVRMLTAQARGNGAEAWEARSQVRRLRTGQDGGDDGDDGDSGRGDEGAGARHVTVGKDVLPAFLQRAVEASDRWTGAREGAFGDHTAHGGPTALPGSPAGAAVDGDPDTAYRGAAAPSVGAGLPGGSLTPPGTHDRLTGTPPLTVRLPKQRRLDSVTVQTGPGSGTRGRVEAHVPDRGWTRLGALSGSGWTHAEGHGVRADALRLTWEDGSAAPVVHEITPWYADGPPASLAFSRDAVYVPVGGTGEVAAELRARRPEEVHGRVRAKAPHGFTVHVPSRTAVPRGGMARVPVRIAADPSVRPGTYDIPVSFGGERRTLTVRAFPRTGGPDLARRAGASASGEETSGFPASAVNDGRADTRWSSPVRDGEWVQLKLREPARVGEVELHWQDAYAKRYRVQVSPDGRRWRTAATVRDGRGGRETVHMDAPADTRYVRVQCDERGTRFGCSLWSVEVRAVRTS